MYVSLCWWRICGSESEKLINTSSIADRNASGAADEMPFNGAVAETLVLFDGIGGG